MNIYSTPEKQVVEKWLSEPPSRLFIEWANSQLVHSRYLLEGAEDLVSVCRAQGEVKVWNKILNLRKELLQVKAKEPKKED